MKKRYKWNFGKMHPTLQIASIVSVGFAFVGWLMAGMWFLYVIMGR